MRRFLPLLPLLLLAACGSAGGSARVGSGTSAPIECAPFARALSGVQIRGAAADWWWQAQGRYRRSYTPEVGSVLVLQRTGRLPSGHVAVVSQVLSSRQILVTQANWVHHHVTEDQPVIDVSAANDWSLVRVWWPPSGQMGITEFPAHGFIRAARPSSHDSIAASTPGAIRAAMNGG